MKEPIITQLEESTIMSWSETHIKYEHATEDGDITLNVEAYMTNEELIALVSTLMYVNRRIAGGDLP